MKTFLISYVSVLIPMLVLDGLWLAITLKSFYSPKLEHLTANAPSFTPAVIFYILYAFGLAVLIVLPALQGNFSLLKVFLYGALMGLIAYAAYDLTNQATLRDWPIVVTVVDMVWGAILSGVVSTLAVYVTKTF